MSQENALAAVRSRKFVVGSVDSLGYFSVASRPFTHASLASAVAECSRLAVINPGTAYVAMQMAGGSLVPKVVNTVIL